MRRGMNPRVTHHQRGQFGKNSPLLQCPTAPERGHSTAIVQSDGPPSKRMDIIALAPPANTLQTGFGHPANSLQSPLQSSANTPANICAATAPIPPRGDSTPPWEGGHANIEGDSG